MGVFYRFWHFPLNGVIAKIILHDLDLPFEVNSLKCYFLWNLRASAKMHAMTFKDFDICQWMIPLQKFHRMTLAYFFKIKNGNFNILETVRLSATCEMTLSTLCFKEHFSFLKFKWTQISSFSFAYTCIAPGIELFLLFVFAAKWEKCLTTSKFLQMTMAVSDPRKLWIILVMAIKYSRLDLVAEIGVLRYLFSSNVAS